MKKAASNINILVMFMVLFYPGMVCGQNRSIKGTISDKESGQPVQMVNVLVEPGGKATLTDEKGSYFIDELPAGELNLKVFCIGYDTVFHKIDPGQNGNASLDLSLTPSSYFLDEVSVSGTGQKISMRKISEITLNSASISLTPSLGMSDLIQHIQTIPGVITRGDIGGQVYIRGGTPVQTKVLLDESVIYNPVHSVGLFSVFDNDYLRSVDFYTGGFDAEFGGCLSSVIDISTKNPNSILWSGKVDLSTIASKLLVEGPLIKANGLGKASLTALFSMKASHFGRSSEWFYSYLDQDLPFYFRDIYAKATLQIGSILNINISGYNFKDRVSENQTFKTYGWNSSGFSINLQTIPAGVPILIKAYAAGSFYQMTLDEPNHDLRYSRVVSLSAGMKFFRFMDHQIFKYGIDMTDIGTVYQYYTNAYNKYNQDENSNELSGFADYQGNFGRWVLEGGLRAVYYTSLSKFSPEPRLSVRYFITENLVAKIATGLYTQNLVGAASDKDIVNFFQGYLSAPLDMVGSPEQDADDFYLQKSWHLVAGLEFEMTNKLFFNIEAYYKDYTQLINFNKNKFFNKEDFPDAPSYMSGTFISETGYAEGSEFSVKYDNGDLRLEINYSLALVKRRYPDPEGRMVEYYPQYDRRHNLNLMGTYIFGKTRGWVATARWNYGSGFPFTPTAGYYEGIAMDENGEMNYLDQNGQISILYGDYNSKRLPAYHRLDLAIKKTFVFRNNTMAETELSLVNAYNRQNIFYINRNTNQTAYQLPILPGLRVSYSF